MTKRDAEIRHWASALQMIIGPNFQELPDEIIRSQCLAAAFMLMHGLEHAYLAKSTGAINEPTILYSVDMI